MGPEVCIFVKFAADPMRLLMAHILISKDQGSLQSIFVPLHPQIRAKLPGGENDGK